MACWYYWTNLNEASDSIYQSRDQEMLIRCGRCSERAVSDKPGVWPKLPRACSLLHSSRVRTHYFRSRCRHGPSCLDYKV
jgi:hypothetical protein